MKKTFHIKKCPILTQSHPVFFLFQIFALLAVLGLPQKGASQVVIGGWDVSTLPGGANNFGPDNYAATQTAANVTVGGFTRGSGISTTGTAAARGWGGTSWGTSFNNGDSSVLFNDFFTFTVKANAGFTLSLSSIGPFDYRRSSTGPLFAEIQYRINAGAYSLITTVSLPSTSTSGASVGSTDLSGIPALQNLPSSSTVTFRIVPFRSTATTGTFYIFDTGASTANDFAVNGSVCAVPSCNVTGPDYVCSNSPGITYSAPAGMSAYSWSISGNGSIPGSTTGQSVSVTSGNFLGDYTVSVTITNASGCTSTCSKQSFIYLQTPPANITVNPNPACFGATLDLSIAAQSSSTVSWTGEGVTNPSGTFVPVGFNGYSFYNNQTTAVPTTTGPHIYTVTVTTQPQGCVNTGTASVTVNPSPSCSITGPTSTCAGSTGNVYSATAGMSAYSWGISGSGSIVGNTTGSSVSVTAGASGTYTVSVTITAANGCTATCSQPVTINPLPSGVITGPPPFPGPSNDTLCTSLQYMFTGPPGMSGHSWWVTTNGTIDGSSTGPSVTITPNSGSFIQVRDTITDANGCKNVLFYSRPVQQSPTCSVGGPTTVCGGSTGNVYTVTTNAGTFGYYVWSISGDGVITSSPTSGYNIPSITVTAGASGTYTVTVDLKFDFNNCLKSCSETVMINSAAAPTITGPTSVCSGGSVTLDAGPGYSAYAWSGGGGSSQTANYTNITSPTTYTVMVTNNGCTGTDTHTVTPESCVVDFSGKIIFSNNNTLGVNNALVSLTGSATGSDLSDVNGDYFIGTAVNTGSFTLKPTKTVNKFNGVTAADATAIQQHVGNITLITDLYKQVAADVNKSSSITTLDASIITQSLLGNPAAQAQFSTSWRFVPTSHSMTTPPWGFPEQRTYTNVTGAQMNQDFYGIKTGDVVTTYANPANLGAGEPLVLRAQDRVLQAGESFSVEFQAAQLNDLAAFQFGLTFDPAQLQFIAVEPGDPALAITADHFGAYSAAQGELRAVWAQATGKPVEEGMMAFRLQFKALQSGARLSEVLHLDDEILPAHAYNSKLEESGVELLVDQSTGTHTPVSALQLQIRPNPFRETTTVSFSLPAAAEVQLRVLDASGRELLLLNKYCAAGHNAETLRLGAYTGSGVLYCELKTPYGVVVEKLAALR